VTFVLSDNFLYNRAADPNKKKELKVRIPAAMHMRLHGLKIMSDKSISAAVTEALDVYFEKENRKAVAGAPADAEA
jgi:hypothetical protein